MRQATGLVIAVLMVTTVASLALNAYQYSSPRTVTATTEVRTTVFTTLLVTTSTVCSISGQPGGIFLRVLSDSTSQPVSGVVVTAVNTPFLCNGSPATDKTVYTFTTNGTEWRSLPSDNNYQYLIIANYQGHTFNLTATLAPVSLTCATLHVPSGRTNTTITEFGNGCH